jgi:hypothetical protein
VRQPPKTGLYTSTKNTPGKQFIVEDVFIDDDADAEDEFFLVQLVEAKGANDMSAIGMELDQDEWFAMVDQYGLIEVSPANS